MKLMIEIPDEEVYELGRKTLQSKIEEYVQILKLEKVLKEVSMEIKKFFSEEDYWKEVEKIREEAWREYKKEFNLK
ncbi:hypothetical protein [Sulfurihydrogenibium azorense]|uniref:hypothetical protein n=1 Tax=Sulfurihydrogenibium azorense TaxID=309806 RepID=UPI002409F700|nr:hypothetical protein [Sulfurihydrogenibium azorense]MDM7273696.1 hypothetical protein [Sulfurihydrogenibium azorense]